MASLLKTDKVSTTAGGAQEFTLPAADGSSGQVLQTDGSGVLSVAALAADTVGVSQISATGTASASTFLRGDNSWASAGGDNTPAFYVWRESSHQSIPYDTSTKIQFNGEIYDPDNVFDSTTNYRFTVPAGEGGNYFFFWDISFEAASNTTFVAYSLNLKVNGTNKVYQHANYTGSYIRRTGIPGSVMLALSAADYVEMWIQGNTTNSAAQDVNYSTGYVHTGFGGFKLL